MLQFVPFVAAMSKKTNCFQKLAIDSFLEQKQGFHIWDVWSHEISVPFEFGLCVSAFEKTALTTNGITLSTMGLSFRSGFSLFHFFFHIQLNPSKACQFGDLKQRINNEFWACRTTIVNYGRQSQKRIIER